MDDENFENLFVPKKKTAVNWINWYLCDFRVHTIFNFFPPGSSPSFFDEIENTLETSYSLLLESYVQRKNIPNITSYFFQSRRRQI